MAVKNDGNEASKKSVVAVKLEEKGVVKWSDDTFIAPLPRRMKRPKLVKLEVPNLTADSGFLTATATVHWALT